MMGEERKVRHIAIPSHPDNFERDEERRKKMAALWVDKPKPCPECGGEMHADTITDLDEVTHRVWLCGGCYYAVVRP